MTKSNIIDGYDEVTLELFKEKVLDASRRIVSGYEVVEALVQSPIELRIAFATQLAYLRARNTINVHNCITASYDDAPQTEINRLCDEAMKFHNWGKDVYWRAVNMFNEDSYQKAGKDNVDVTDIVKLYSHLQLSREKVSEIEKKVQGGDLEARFPGLFAVRGVRLDPIKLFDDIVATHISDIRDNKVLPRVVELAYRGAQDTLAIRNCLTSMTIETSLAQRKKLYDDAKITHQERSLAFWEPMHEVHVMSYERAKDPLEKARLRDLADMSGEKLTKLETRHLGMEGDELDPDRLRKLLNQSPDGDGSGTKSSFLSRCLII